MRGPPASLYGCWSNHRLDPRLRRWCDPDPLAVRRCRAKARGVHDETVRVARRLHGQLAIVERTREVDAEEVGADVVPARDSEAVAQGPTRKANQNLRTARGSFVRYAPNSDRIRNRARSSPNRAEWARQAATCSRKAWWRDQGMSPASCVRKFAARIDVLTSGVIANTNAMVLGLLQASPSCNSPGKLWEPRPVRHPSPRPGPTHTTNDNGPGRQDYQTGPAI